MNKAMISCEVDLTEGGCNACGIVKSESYHLNLGGRDIPLDGLTVSSLVMTIVLADGWQQAFKVNMMDEYTQFTKNAREVILVEDVDQLKYNDGKQVIQCRNQMSDETALFKQVNLILEEIFGLAAYEFLGK